jgi:hypothetical protein
MVRSAMALPQLLAGAPSNATTWPLHRTKRGSLSRVAATFLPIGPELRLGLSHGRRAPIGHNSKLRIDVHRDQPKPTMLGPAMSVLIIAAPRRGLSASGHEIGHPERKQQYEHREPHVANNTHAFPRQLL